MIYFIRLMAIVLCLCASGELFGEQIWPLVLPPPPEL